MDVARAVSILANKKVHWALKASVVKVYWEENPTIGVQQLAYRLRITLHELFDFERLAHYAKKYPKLTYIRQKKEALQLILNTDDSKLREAINIASTKNKSKLILDELKKRVENVPTRKKVATEFRPAAEDRIKIRNN